MAREPMVQDTSILPSDPYIRDSRSSVVEPGYIRDSDLESGFVRYPRAGGRLIEKGVGALMDDPLGLVTGALSGAYDYVRDKDPATLVQSMALDLGLPIVESGERLASGDYEGLTLEEEEEARILDALTVAELVPLLGLGIKGVTGALRRRLRAENPGVDDAEIEAMVAQMELDATRPDPYADDFVGDADLGPRPDELSLEDLEARSAPLAELDPDDRAIDETLGGLPLTDDDLYHINASRAEDGEPPLTLDEAIIREYDEVFPDGDRDYDDQIRLFFGERENDDFGDLVPDDDTDTTYYANLAARLNDVLDTQLPRYFGDTDQMTTSDALVGIGEDYVAELESMGYGADDIFSDLDEALTARGYTADQRQQLMDELFPPVLTEPGQPLDPWRNVADADDIEPFVPGDGYDDDIDEQMANAAVEFGELTDEGLVPGSGYTPPHQLEAMDFSLTGNDTALNSRFEEVVLAPGAPKKFANKQEFINFLTNQKNGVTNAELEARGIDRLSDGPIDLDDPDVRRWVFRDPLKVRILEGMDTQYKGYFLPYAKNYRETVVTLDGSPFDGDMVSGGVIGDSQHFVNTQRSMGGPELLHIRTGQFEVLDPPTTEKPATVAGKTFHVGEIQSQATQDARFSRKSRNLFERVGNGDVDLGAARLEAPFLQIAKLKQNLPEDRPNTATIQVARDRIRELEALPQTPDRIEEINHFKRALADLVKNDKPEIEDQIKAILEKNNLPETFYEDTLQAMMDSKLFNDQVNYVLNGLMEGKKANRPGDVANDLAGLVSQVENYATGVNVDDLGVGSLYQTDRITNIAVKQALEQAIDTGADFITFNRGDLVHGMTGGDLAGHKEYYDRILPKNVNKLLAKLEKQHKVKLPRLEKLKLKTESGPELGRVLGFKLTPELRKIFKDGVQAFKSGGMVELKSLGIGSMGREVLL